MAYFSDKYTRDAVIRQGITFKFMRDGTLNPDQLHSLTKVSKYAYDGWKEAFEILSKEPNFEDLYLLGPAYIEGDSQVCITGKVGRNESDYRDACIRELAEELGITPVSPNALIDVKVTGAHKTYRIHCKNIVAYTSASSVTTSGGDDKSRRCQTFVYGTMSEILLLLASIRKRKRARDTGRIVGITLFKLTDIIRLAM